jgi:hypothetical protein
MKRSQLVALAERKQFKLTAEAENFIYFIEQAMRNSIAKEMYELEEKLHQEGNKDASDAAYRCALIAKKERDLV